MKTENNSSCFKDGIDLQKLGFFEQAAQAIAFCETSGVFEPAIRALIAFWNQFLKNSVF